MKKLFMIKFLKKKNWKINTAAAKLLVGRAKKYQYSISGYQKEVAVAGKNGERESGIIWDGEKK